MLGLFFEKKKKKIIKKLLYTYMLVLMVYYSNFFFCNSLKVNVHFSIISHCNQNNLKAFFFSKFYTSTRRTQN